MRRGWVLSVAVMGIFLVVAAFCRAGEEEKMKKEDLKPLLGNPEVVVIDVRTHGDYESSPFKIQGAVRENPIEVDTWSRKYPEDKTLVLYCS